MQDSAVRVVDTTTAFSRTLSEARHAGLRVGLVPTMGALHAGHRSLIDRAMAECDHVAVTVFVNPLQFGSAEDLECYPRTLDADVAVCAAAGVDTVFAPSVAEMYPGWPNPVATTVSVRGLTDDWEGASRPGHFDGVATVVAKLFSMAGACTAYFGEKDFQQLAVIRRMVADLSMPIELVACSTVREADGLALSSRNVRLGAAERRAAAVLHHALEAGRQAVAGGEDRPTVVVGTMSGVIGREPLVRLDYAAAVDAQDLSVPGSLSDVSTVRLLVAADVGGVRLIDNCAAPVPTGPAPRTSAPVADAAGNALTGRALAGNASASRHRP